MVWYEERYCEANYDDVTELPFVGAMSSVTINLGDGFKIRGNQTDKDYRKIFEKLGAICLSMCSETVHFVMLGGTSFTSGSGGGNSKAHLHFLIYTNDEAIVETIRDYAQSLDPDNKKAIRVNFGGTNEVVDYVLGQRNEPAPLLFSDLKGIRGKSIVKTIVHQYPPAKRRSHNDRLNTWNTNFEKKFHEFCAGLEVETLQGVKRPPFGPRGVFDSAMVDKIVKFHRLQRQKVSEQGDISEAQLEAIRLEMTGIERAFMEWANKLSLVASYCVVSYWNDRIADRINRRIAKRIGHKVPLMTIYTKGQAWEKNYKVMPWYDGRSKEARKLKEEGWATEKR